MNLLESKSPIVEGVIINILNTYPIYLQTKEKHVLNAELVPQIHEKIMQRENLQESMFHGEEKLKSEQIKPTQLQVSKKITILKNKEILKSSEKPQETFKKILPMLQDPFVSYIECKGPNQSLSVIKNGRTQITNMIMDRGEIDEYLKYLSEKTRVPLVEGVFNVRVDDYTINAIISNSIEPSFIIKKNLPNPLAYQR